MRELFKNGLEDKINKETQGRQLKKKRNTGPGAEQGNHRHSLTQDLDLAGVNPDLGKDREELSLTFAKVLI
jgi:hypothetical protein